MKNDKGKNILITIFVSIIILLLVIIYLIYNGTIKLKVSTNNDNEENKTNLSIKIDENLEYVYDATYSYDNKYTEFNRSLGEVNSIQKLTEYGIEVEYTSGVQYLKNLKVPYININTYDAGKTNKELELLYIESAKRFDLCAEDDEHGGCSQILTYRTYKYENILSIVIIESSQTTTPFILNYKVYNFDLTTGKKLSYNEVLSKMNYELNETTNELEQLLKEKMDSLYGEAVGDLSKACYGENGKKLNCYETANQLLNESIKNNSILYFVDNSGELNVLAIAYYNGVQNGELNHYLIKVLNNKNN